MRGDKIVSSKSARRSEARARTRPGATSALRTATTHRTASDDLRMLRAQRHPRRGCFANVYCLSKPSRVCARHCHIAMLLRRALRVARTARRATPTLRTTPLRCLSTDGTTDKQPTERRFEAETASLLNIVSNALYTEREVFLRELLSNASDALEKLRQKRVAKERVSEGDDELKISISVDKDKKQLMIEDSGVGMRENELAENLGTIALSGSEGSPPKLLRRNRTRRRSSASSGLASTARSWWHPKSPSSPSPIRTLAMRSGRLRMELNPIHWARAARRRRTRARASFST